MDIKKRQFAVQALRRASLRWRPRNEARILARTERKINDATGRLAWHSKCKTCGLEKPDGQMELDHLVPVIGKEGFTNFDNYIDRLYCEVNNFQILCTNCHDIKSLAEGQIRKKKRKKKP